MKTKHNPVGTRVTGLLALIAVVAIVAGIPAVLLAIDATTLPGSVPTWDTIETALLSPDDGTLALGVLQVVAWVAWAFLTFSIILESIARVRRLRVPSLPGMRLPQSAARGLVGAAALLFITTPVGIQPAEATVGSVPDTHAGHVATTAATPQRSPGGSDTAEAPRSDSAKAAPRTVAHTVRAGESLWSIAEDHLGSGTRYDEIAALNNDVLGESPGFVRAGWVLRIPADDTDDTQRHGQQRYTVQPGDTLSEIAHEQLGDASRYPAIVAASRDITQSDGVHLHDPDVIDVGWTLHIPATAPSTNPDPDPTTTPKREPGPRATPPAPRGASPQGTGNQNGGTAHSDHHTQNGGHPGTHPAQRDPRAAFATPAHPKTETPHQQLEHDVDEPAVGEAAELAPWLLTGLTGGGVVLSAALYLGLRRRRREQARARRPGRTKAVPDPVLAPVEKTIHTTGAATAATVELMDDALRRLAAAHAAAHTPMPTLAAVELAPGQLVLHLSNPATLTAPWQGTADRLHWTLPTDIDLDQAGPPAPDQPAAYPLLVTIGHSDAGQVWLLNCEELATLSISGDPTYARDFARYLAAELAMNPWSRDARVDCIGVGEEITAMNPTRIRSHPATEAGRDVLAEVLADAVATLDRATTGHSDVVTGRTGQIDDDTWPARLLLLHITNANEDRTLAELLRLVEDHPVRTGTAVVLTGDGQHAPGAVLHLSSTGRVTLPVAGLDLVAVGLTPDEAQGCAALVAQAEDHHDVEVPADQAYTSGWRSYADEAGALRSAHTHPRGTPTGDLDEPVGSLLAGDDEDYVREAATTPEDLQALAPQVSVRVRDEVQAADPTLDADVEAWFSDQCDLPRLALLGPVGARTHGDQLAVVKRKPYYTELLAYLGTRPYGATPAEVAEAFAITSNRVRTDIKAVRDWLGVNPRTGEKHLPDATKSTAARTRGVNTYEVDGLLVDADLFRRLRVRGQARGKDGIDDLDTALTLVTGRPFDQLRPAGWNWLHGGDRLDHHMVVAVVDVGHLVTTHHLERGNLARAQATAELAALAAPNEEITKLNLARIAEAQGYPHQAEKLLREDVCDRADDGGAPSELSERTETIIKNHGWLAAG